jgi:diguanylate cyclase (GGDEF)-like protein
MAGNSSEGLDARPGTVVQSSWLAVLLLTGITIASYEIAQFVQDHWYAYLGLEIDSWGANALEVSIIAACSASLVWPVVLRPLRQRTAEAEAETRQREQILRDDRNTQEFHAQLHRALEMANVEDGAYTVARRAVSVLAPESTVELLLADSSEAHLKPAMQHAGADRRLGCSVSAPHDCPAIRRGQTAVYSSDRELDACPWLVDRDSEATGAVCIPVSTIGRSIGVLHTVGPAGSLPDRPTVAALEAVAEQVGARIGTIRVMEKTHLQAATDPLTGLLNRRSVENMAKDLLHRGVPFALAMGDLDNFKKLNDTHGHDTGDRALRQFARVLRTVLRSEDLVSRYGGEEFVLVFPGQQAAAAAAALTRVQESLLVAGAAGTTPAFTVTFGVAHSDEAGSLEELVRIADAALFRGKREGRNRVIWDQSAQEART